MNSIAVIELGAGAAPLRFGVPVVCVGRQSRPRWGEGAARGIFERERVASAGEWLVAAERLQGVRVGTEGHPPWHAVIQEHPDGATLILAVNHALTDWRTSLHVA